MEWEPEYFVRELRDPASERLCAKQSADYLGVELRVMAGILKKTLVAVRYDTDAPELQATLARVERIVGGLSEVFGGNRALVLWWLTAQNRHLEDDSPMDLMIGDELGVVVDMVDDILTGAPA